MTLNIGLQFDWCKMCWVLNAIRQCFFLSSEQFMRRNPRSIIFLDWSKATLNRGQSTWRSRRSRRWRRLFYHGPENCLIHSLVHRSRVCCSQNTSILDRLSGFLLKCRWYMHLLQVTSTSFYETHATIKTQTGQQKHNTKMSIGQNFCSTSVAEKPRQ